MTTAIKRRRGTTSEHSTFTGLAGEITIDTTKDTVVVHDGSTAGGFPLAKENNPTFTGTATFTGDVSFGDNDKAIFGAGSDLQIYHDGTDSYIRDAGTGSLVIQASENLKLQSHTGEYYFQGIRDGASKIYYDNAEKLVTTSTGIDVAGTILADGLTVGGTGRVGIGTTSPSSFQSYANNLVVGTGDGGEGITVYSGHLDYGALVFADGNGSNSQLRPGQVVYDHGTNSMFFDTNGSERMRITSAGLVGIGTSLPAAQLDISSATTSTLRLSNTETVLTENQITGQLEFYQADVSASSSGTGITGKIRMRSVPNLNSNYYGLAADMDFNVSGEAQGYASDNATLTAMTIQAGSGNVGIGESNPATRLEIKDATPILRLTDSLNAATQVAGHDIARISFFSDDASGIGPHETGFILNESEQGGSSLSGALVFGTAQYNTAATERMRIDSNGNVGISESDPSGYWAQANQLVIENGNCGLTLKSSVDGNGRLVFTDTKSTTAGLNDGGMISYNHTDDAMIVQTAGAERLRITSAGRVGIGTSLPGENLHISAPNPVIRLQESDQTGSHFGQILFNSSSLRLRARADTALGNIRFEGQNATNTVEYARFDSSGNLLVGTTDTSPHNNSGTTSGGIALHSDSYLSVGRSSGAAMFINRQSNDGDIIDFRKDGTTVGSIGSAAGVVSYHVLDPRSGGVGIMGTNFNNIIPTNNAGTPADNAKDLGLGSQRWRNLYLGGGVYLGGTGDANKLDDYEEGTFNLASVTSGYTLSSSVCRYTKIGNTVHIWVKIAFSAINTSSDSSFFASGLPFSASTNNPDHFIGVGRETVSTGAIFVAQITNSTSSLNVNSMDGISDNSNSSFATGKNYNIQVTYRTG